MIEHSCTPGGVWDIRLPRAVVGACRYRIKPNDILCVNPGKNVIQDRSHWCDDSVIVETEDDIFPAPLCISFVPYSRVRSAGNFIRHLNSHLWLIKIGIVFNELFNLKTALHAEGPPGIVVIGVGTQVVFPKVIECPLGVTGLAGNCLSVLTMSRIAHRRNWAFFAGGISEDEGIIVSTDARRKGAFRLCLQMA